MIGLVVTSTASWVGQIVQKFRSLVKEPLSLKDELAVRGVAIYSLESVRQFQRDYLQKEVGAGRAGRFAKWVRLSVEDNYGYVNPIPPKIQKTIEKVQSIPMTKVIVECFDRDPFVFVERQRKLDGLNNKEIFCIGYWNAPGFQP